MLDDETRLEAEMLIREILTGETLFRDLQSCEADEERMANALKNALQNPDTNDFDVGVVIASAMLRDGQRLPDWLAVFAADVLEGKRNRPTKRGPDPYTNWQRDYCLALAVLEISSRFGVPEYTKNELSYKTTAAQIVAETTQQSLDVVHHAIKRFGGDIKRQSSPQD